MQQVGPYELQETLGQGAMGVVYRGRDPTQTREVAIKVLDSELGKESATLGRFLAEARTLMRIRHPNVVEVLDVGSSDVHYMVMELLAGEPLSHILSRGALPLEWALGVAADLASALSAVHLAGVVHRDIKPDNLMITPAGELKLIDFGVAREAAELNVMHTQSGALLGTPAYMAPEQVCGKPVDLRADVYAFGAVLYEIVTGKRAFTADNFASLVVQHLTLRVPPPSELTENVPAALDSLVAQCLAKEPGDRPADMDEVETLLRQMQVFVRHARPLARHPKRSVRKWGSAAIVASVVTVFASGWGIAQHRTPLATPAVAGTKHATAQVQPLAEPVQEGPAEAVGTMGVPLPLVVPERAHAKPAKHLAKKRTHPDFDKAGLIDAFAP